jgi:head-tail adaptor
MPLSFLGTRVRAASGLRDKRVQIEQGVKGVGESGRPITTWTALGQPVYMSKVDTLGDERFAASQESAWGQAQWVMPYQPNMDPDRVDVPGLRRLNYLGRIFDIQAASVLEGRLGIVVITLAKVDAV